MQSTNKIVLFFLVVSLFSTIAFSQSFDSETYSVEYAYNPAEVRIEGLPTSSGEEVSIEVCGKKFETTTIETGDGMAVFSLLIPDDVMCGQGKHQITSDDISDTAQLEVQTQGNQNPHVGKNIFVNFDHGDGSVRAFQLTDYTLEGAGDYGSYEDSGNIMIHQYRVVLPSQRVVYQADLGKVIGGNQGDMDSLIDITSFETDNCDFLGCKTLTEPFSDVTPGIISSQSTKSTDGLERISPIHGNGGQYMPEGQIAYGTYPEAYTEDENQLQPSNNEYNADDELFFICREGATMPNGFGQEVKQVVDLNPNPDEETLYHCTDQGKWERTYQCEDGLDNDNDQGIDQTNSLPGVSVDDECNSNQDSEVGCKPRIGIDEGTKYAYYDAGQGNYDPTGNDCNYERESTDDGLATGNPVTGECFPGGTGSNGYLLPLCSALEGSNSAFHDWRFGNRVTAVKYHVPAEAIPTTEQNPEVASQFVKNTDDTQLPAENRQKCIRTDKGGFVNTRCETLHMAENKYSSPVEPPHAAITWQDRNMTNLEGYINNNPVNYSKAWITGNASLSTNRIDGEAGQDSDISSTTVFDGGFAGNCKTGKTWSYVEDENRWACSGTPDQALQVDFYNIDPQDTDRYVGFELPGSEAAKWEEMLGVPAVPSSGASNLQIQARCWQGEPGQRPTNTDQIISLSKEVTTTATGETNIVAGQVPENSQVGSIGDSSYTCNFGFQQEIINYDLVPSNDDVFDSSGSSVTDVLECELNINCYIVQGSNANPPVEVTVNNVDPGSEIQSKLENAASNTNRINYDPFGTFPVSQNNIRDPFAVWEQKY